MRHSSLKTKISLAVSLLIIGILSLSALFTLWYFEGEIKRLISEQQYVLITEIAGDIDERIETARDIISACAGQFPAELVSDPEQAQHELDYHLGVGTRHIFDNGIFLFSPDGMLVAESPYKEGRRGRDYSFREYFQETLATGRPLVSDPYFSSQSHGHPAINFTAPIFDARGRIAGVLAGSLDLTKDNFFGELQRMAIGQTGYLYLFDTRRTIIMHKDASRILKADVSEGANLAFDRALQGFQGTTETINSRNQPMLVSFKRLKSKDWILASNYPLTEAYLPVQRAKMYAGGGLAIASLLTLALVWLMVRRLTSPLLHLTDHIRKVAERNPRRGPLEVGALDEVGLLGEAYGRMLGQLEAQELNLENQLNFFQILIDNIPTPVYYKDIDGSYLGCNSAFEAFWGISRNQIIGKTFFSDQGQDLDAVLRDEERMQDFEGNGPSVQVSEARATHSDGRPREILLYKTAFPNIDGSPGGMIGSIIDISHRKAAELALAEQKEFSENLLQNSAIPCFVLDAEHRVIIWNRACERLTGICAGEAVGQKSPWHAFYDRERQLLGDLILDQAEDQLGGLYAVSSKSELLSGGLRAEGWYPGLGGKDRYLAIEAAPLRNSRGEIVAAIENLQDITERKLAEETLRYLAHGTEASPGEEFFGSLVRYLSRMLNVDLALVGEFDTEDPNRVRTVAVCDRGDMVENFVYSLRETPCEVVVEEILCIYPEGVAERFPKDLMLAEMGIQGYAGVRLRGAEGKVLGILVVLDRRPLQTVESIRSLMEVMAVRAAVELERRRSREAQENSLSLLRATLESTADGILVTDNDGGVVTCNRKFAEMWRIPQTLLANRSSRELLDFVLPQVKDPDGFLERTRMLSQGSEVEDWDTVPFEDGRIYERFTKAQRVAGGIVGRVWSFRDVTQRRRFEQELLKTRDFYLTIFEEFPAMIWRSNQTGKCDYFNRTWLDFTGKSMNEEIGERWLENVHPDDLGTFLGQFRQALQARSMFSVELRLRRHDGCYRWMTTVGRPFNDFAGRFAGFIGASFDITERREALEQVRNLSLAVEQSPNSVVVTDLRGRIVYVNPKFTEVSGFSLEEVRGMTPAVLRSGRTTAEEYRKLWNTIGSGQVWKGEFLNKRKTGELFWESALISPVTGPDQKITHFVAVKEDITERKRTQESERRSRGLSEAMTEATLCFLQQGSINEVARILVERCVSLTSSAFGFLYDLDGKGDARILATAGLPLAGQSLQVVHQEVRAASPEQVYHLLERSQGLLFAPIDQRRTILANSEFPRELMTQAEQDLGFPVRSFLGAPLCIGSEAVGCIGLINSEEGFTERERVELEAFAQTAALVIQSVRTELARQLAEDYLGQAQKMEAVGQLAGGVAHDFNNLVTVINGYSTMLARSLKDDPKRRREAETILQAGERAAALTRQLLAFSRRQVLEPRVLDINPLVKGLDKILRGLLREQIGVEMLLEQNLGRVKADPGQVEQVLINLVVNSRDAISGDGKITIRTANVEIDTAFARQHNGSVPGDYVMLEVTDTGDGMTPEVRQRIFEPFFTTKEQGRGTGLGLATVYGIVKQSGGYILVESNPGEGTQFRVYLPRTADNPAANRRRLPTPPREGHQMVLVVEDEAAVLALVADALRGSGYRVLAAHDPAQALKLFEGAPEQVDLLLTDMVMPEMSGPSLAEALRRQRADLRVLFMSGYSDLNEDEGLEVFERKYLLQKPFTMDTLLAKVHDVLGAA
ncbi:hypothetical protein DESUT3_14870 [Desulfuromonas versatilis]|uniref:histidine kinase n=1 Tax=Desulfuromonas versatilis TaxID=2802975 RepID=A0ABN6DWA3_9BACT|nr:PAS domain S-box protein [Desulfuromonas versatilis]BCR04418.1 hypothetical protein DESUT3_14870 [Desulfuromonas versatilis]